MGIMLETITSDDYRLLPGGHGWSCFQKESLELANGQRSDRPRVAMEVILEAADGFAACTVTNAELARRLDCKPEAVGPVLAILERLALIRCIRDPRIREGRWIVLTQHFAASAVLTELGQSRRVVGRNEDLEQEQAPVAGEIKDEGEPDVLSFEKYLGPAQAERERRAQWRDGLRDRTGF